MKKICAVETSFGRIVAESSGAKDEYPGILIYLEVDGKDKELVACVEHDTLNNKVQACSYNQEFEWPINIEIIDVKNNRKEVV